MDYSNYFFTGVFLLEMLIKLVALGFYGYIKDGSNLFDGLIVVISVVELTENNETSGISVLRTFRLLRILKLFRFVPILKRQIEVMFKTLESVGTFFFLLGLFIFIFR